MGSSLMDNPTPPIIWNNKNIIYSLWWRLYWLTIPYHISCGQKVGCWRWTQKWKKKPMIWNMGGIMIWKRGVLCLISLNLAIMLIYTSSFINHSCQRYMKNNNTIWWRKINYYRCRGHHIGFKKMISPYSKHFKIIDITETAIILISLLIFPISGK